ncbi:C-3 sterol dehydrogenase [Cytidiella melzeri]|nr:C-3 sterol dehydrogenase [Cytidiella melzeri]
MSSGKRDVYMVFGGSGFVGRHIVEHLLARGDIVSVFDTVQRYHDTPFYAGDITEPDQIADALVKSGTTCIFHTVSPHHGLQDPALYWKVNVDGTIALLTVAKAHGVRKLVYTSSASVMFKGEDLINVDERTPIPSVSIDAYNESKVKAEQLVLEANGKEGLLTVALRPAAIFGPGDRQSITGYYDAWKRGQTHWQIGDGTNLFDCTYVGNVAHAHLLAADKLDVVPPADQLTPEQVEQIASTPLPPVTVTTGKLHIPTSVSRPLGPYVTPPENAEQILKNWENPDYQAAHPREFRRSRFDQFSENGLAGAEVSPLQVAGQAFLITNGEPIPFWDFARSIWYRFDKHYGTERYKKKPIVMSNTVGLVLAYASEWWGWVVGKQPAFTVFRVKTVGRHKWHNIEKARRVLGYEPIVGLEEGMQRTVDEFVQWLDANPSKA